MHWTSSQYAQVRLQMEVGSSSFPPGLCVPTFFIIHLPGQQRTFRDIQIRGFVVGIILSRNSQNWANDNNKYFRLFMDEDKEVVSVITDEGLGGEDIQIRGHVVGIIHGVK